MHGKRCIGHVLVLAVTVLALSPLLFLPSISSAQEEIYGIKFGTAGTFAEFHGFINTRYFDFEKDGSDAGEGSAKGTSTLDVHNLYIAALAKVHPRVSIFGEVEYEHTGKDLDEMEIFVDRAFIDWRAIDQYLTIRMGTFNPPIGYELAEYVAPVRKFESRPFYVDEILFHEWVDAGIWGRGNLATPAGKILYDLSILNGPEGLTKGDLTNKDINSDRALLGRIAFAPNIGEIGYSEIGLSYATGNYDIASDREFKIFVVDARVQVMGLDIRGEYADRSGDDQVAATSTIEADAKGYYVQASYKMLQGGKLINYVEPKIRYDNSDTNSGDELSRVTVGVNWSPYPHFLFKTEYQIIDEDKADLDNNGFMISAVVDF